MNFRPSPPAQVPVGGPEHIHVYVGDVTQLFNPMDPSPLIEQDLDPRAEEFIISWAREAPRGAPLALTVHVDRTETIPGGVPNAISEYFRYRADVTRRRLRELFRVGRVSLLIGLLALALTIAVVNFLASTFSGVAVLDLLREGVLIGGWVAMWRPLEIFLYEWWPIRRDIQLFERLGAMPVDVIAGAGAG